jgi:hypothetical protein
MGHRGVVGLRVYGTLGSGRIKGIWDTGEW